MMNRVTLLALFLSFGLGSCNPSTPDSTSESESPTIYTTFYPTTYWAERMAGSFANVVCPVPPDEDPIFWNPPREAIAKYQEADMIVINGADFEKWVANTSLPESRIVDTADPMAHRFLTFETLTHSHGGGGHTHEGIDGHTWVDPTNAIFQADVLRKALVEKWPAHKSVITEKYKALEADLKKLDARFQALNAQLSNTRLFASHPAYDYVAKNYGWKINNFDIDPGSPLEPETKTRIQELTQEGADKFVLLWESEPLNETRAALSEMGVKSVWFSPAESLSQELVDEGIDYMSLMNANLDRLESALK